MRVVGMCEGVSVLCGFVVCNGACRGRVLTECSCVTV